MRTVYCKRCGRAVEVTCQRSDVLCPVCRPIAKKESRDRTEARRQDQQTPARHDKYRPCHRCPLMTACQQRVRRQLEIYCEVGVVIPTS